MNSTGGCLERATISLPFWASISGHTRMIRSAASGSASGCLSFVQLAHNHLLEFSGKVRQGVMSARLPHGSATASTLGLPLLSRSSAARGWPFDRWTNFMATHPYVGWPTQPHTRVFRPTAFCNGPCTNSPILASAFSLQCKASKAKAHIDAGGAQDSWERYLREGNYAVDVSTGILSPRPRKRRSRAKL